MICNGRVKAILATLAVYAAWTLLVMWGTRHYDVAHLQHVAMFVVFLVLTVALWPMPGAGLPKNIPKEKYVELANAEQMRRALEHLHAPAIGVSWLLVCLIGDGLWWLCEQLIALGLYVWMAAQNLF